MLLCYLDGPARAGQADASGGFRYGVEKIRLDGDLAQGDLDAAQVGLHRGQQVGQMCRRDAGWSSWSRRSGSRGCRSAAAPRSARRGPRMRWRARRSSLVGAAGRRHQKKLGLCLDQRVRGVPEVVVVPALAGADDIEQGVLPARGQAHQFPSLGGLEVAARQQLLILGPESEQDGALGDAGPAALADPVAEFLDGPARCSPSAPGRTGPVRAR